MEKPERMGRVREGTDLRINAQRVLFLTMSSLPAWKRGRELLMKRVGGVALPKCASGEASYQTSGASSYEPPIHLAATAPSSDSGCLKARIPSMSIMAWTALS